MWRSCPCGRPGFLGVALRSPERPREAYLCLSLHLNFLIWKIGTLLLLLLAVCFSGTERTERFAYALGFELSDYIKVKVLRTEISKLQGKSA